MGWTTRGNAHVKVTLELAHAVANKGRVFAFPGRVRS
jgi:hypothetical protein